MTKLAIAVALVVTWVRAAHAGPYCGFGASFAPADETVLPVAPVIAQNVEDHYAGGKRLAKAVAPRIHATVDGKRVSITTKDVRTVEGVIRFIKIGSRKTGKLEIWSTPSFSAEEKSVLATYTIAKDWSTAETPTVDVTRGQDRRLAPYRYVGELAVLRVDVPAIAFTLRWRRDKDDAWRTHAIPASIEAWPSETHRSEARLGQTMCGMIENVPLAFLEKGIEVELAAKLPNGHDVAITEGLPSPLVIPPKPPEWNDGGKR